MNEVFGIDSHRYVFDGESLWHWQTTTDGGIGWQEVCEAGDQYEAEELARQHAVEYDEKHGYDCANQWAALWRR